MLKNILVFLSALLCLQMYAQNRPDFGSVNSHEYYVLQLSNSKDQNFQEIIRLYERYIQAHPNDIRARIELCKLIGNSYIDEYEGYNLKYEETEECIENLWSSYPSEPKVLIYRAENLYGEDRLDVLNKAVESIESEEKIWASVEKASIYKMLGDYHEDVKYRSLLYYKKAQKLNDSLDLSLPIARIYFEQDKIKAAKEILMPNLEKDTAKWVMNQKANLLLKLEEPEKALHLFDYIRQKDSAFIDNEEMSNVMRDLGNLEMARDFLVKDTVQQWNKQSTKQLLFEHDLKYSDGKTALSTYRKLQEENSYDDLFGVKRLRIFLKSPFLAWSPSEVFHFFLLHVLVVIAFLVPYLWVLPVYGLGTLLKKNGIAIAPKLKSKWNLSHFWLVSFFYLFISIFVSFLFDYQGTMGYYFDVNINYGEEVDDGFLANQMLLFVALMAVTTMLVLTRDKVKYVFKSNISIRQIIGLSILFTIFNRFFIKGLSLFVDLEETVGANSILNVKEEILAIISQNGFLVAALTVSVIVPIYEEVIFRGVILGAVEKYLGFKGANVVQAILFGLVHDDLALFPFFFVFALITGYWVKKSGGLLTGIFFHGIHNFSIVLALYYLSRLTLTMP